MSNRNEHVALVVISLCAGLIGGAAIMFAYIYFHFIPLFCCSCNP